MVWGPRLSTLSVPRVVLNYTAKYNRKVRYLIQAGSYDSNSVYRYHFHPFANMCTRHINNKFCSGNINSNNNKRYFK